MTTHVISQLGETRNDSSARIGEMTFKRPLRVLEVTARYIPFIGGVENHVYQVSRRLAKAGVDITVLTTDSGRQLESSEIVEGVKIERVSAWPANRDYYFAPNIYRKIMENKWDVVHVQCYHTLVPPLAMLAALNAHIPYVVTFHGGGHPSHLRNSLRATQRMLLRPLLARAERLVAIAEFEISLYGKELHFPKEKFCLIPNGSDLPPVHRTGEMNQSKGTLIASVGRLESYKGHQRILAAMPKLIELIPDIHLWIAGNGPYEPELRRLAKKLGVEERVDIRAIQSSDRTLMAEELSKAALVVLFSEFETQPIAILEALFLARPVLVADTSGLSELAQKGMARAIPLNSSPNQIAVAAAEQIFHPLKQAQFHLSTWDECATGLLALYESVSKDAHAIS